MAEQTLRQAVEALLEIGKRDLRNPKYDGYFDDLAAALAQPDAGEGKRALGKCTFCGNDATPPAALCNDEQTARICQSCIAKAAVFFKVTPVDTPPPQPSLTPNEWLAIAARANAEEGRGR